MKRTKRRYLALQIDCENLPTEREFVDAVWAAISKLYGEVVASTTGLSLINLNVEHKTAVIRVSLVSLGMVRASLASMTGVAGRSVAVHVLGVSGTIKALYESGKGF